MSRDLTQHEQWIASSPSRQVRRQRKRLSKKGRTGWFTPIPSPSRSKYMPHIGKKERGRYAA